MRIKFDITIHKIYYYVNRHPLLFGTIHLLLWIFNQCCGCAITDILESLLDGILW